MSYTNSPLVEYTRLSPNHSGQRTHAIDRITPHCVVGQLSVETLGNIFANKKVQASCQYGIGADGKVGMYVEEKNRSWCSSSNPNDQRAVTIECASDTKHPYAFRDVVYKKLIDLCVDICRRNGKSKLLWLGDKAKTLAYAPKPDEMILTVHRWFANKACPGDWLYSRLGELAAEVTRQLGGQQSTPNSGTLTYDTFDHMRYANDYADLKKAFGYNKQSLWRHYNQFGVKEKRKAYPILCLDTFDHTRYANDYPDVKAVFGYNKHKLWEHYQLFGIKEKRKAYTL